MEKVFIDLGVLLMDLKNNFWMSLFKFIVKPVNLVSVLFTSLLLLFCNAFPLSLKKEIGFYNFLIKYNFLIFVIFLCSFFLTINLLYSLILKRITEKKNARKLDSLRRQVIYLDDCWEVLKKFYLNKNKTLRLPSKDRSVIILNSLKMISVVSKCSVVYGPDDFENPYFYYVLQPSSEEYIKERLAKESK